MSKPLVIVESPTKVKTISKILGDGYIVKSSVDILEIYQEIQNLYLQHLKKKTYYGVLSNLRIMKIFMLFQKIEKKL